MGSLAIPGRRGNRGGRQRPHGRHAMLAPMPAIARAPTDPAGVLEQTLRRVVPAGARVMLAVSGGSDSMALLAAAHEVLPAGDGLLVAHVRHGLRPDDGEDAALVADTCAALDRPCTILRAPAADAARSETAARRRRMAALSRTARDAGAPAILLAHHVDDDLETLLLHLLRGHRGDRALAGIPAVRPLDQATRLVRPFLAGPAPADRDALAATRRAAGLPFRDDPTNRDASIPRNRVRAWLATAEQELRVGLRRVQLAARARLQSRQLAAAAAVESGLQREGLGCRVSRDALLDHLGADPDQDLAERLRLAARCLRRPRRLDTRGAVLRDLRRMLRAGSGGLRLPASPDPIDTRVSRTGLHLPHEALAEGPPAARVVAAVAAGSLYL